MPPPFRPRRPRPTRRWLPAALLGITVLSLAFSGSPYWVPLLAGQFWILFDPRIVLAALREGAPYALLTLLILGAHEMGHYLACRYYRIPATLPFFFPGIPPLGTFGAVIRIRGIIPHRKALFDVAAAGPLAGFAIALPVYFFGWLLAEPSLQPPDGPGIIFGKPILRQVLESLHPGTVQLQLNHLLHAGWVGMLVTSLNLFPVGQLDGGHVAYAISRRLHRLLALATLTALFIFLMGILITQHQVPAYTLWFVILVWLRDRHPRLRDETAPVGAVRICLAVLLLLIFLLSFIPVPLQVFGP